MREPIGEALTLFGCDRMWWDWLALEVKRGGRAEVSKALGLLACKVCCLSDCLNVQGCFLVSTFCVVSFRHAFSWLKNRTIHLHITLPLKPTIFWHINYVGRWHISDHCVGLSSTRALVSQVYV